jgi:hypothetical protein
MYSHIIQPTHHYYKAIILNTEVPAHTPQKTPPWMSLHNHANLNRTADSASQPGGTCFGALPQPTAQCTCIDLQNPIFTAPLVNPPYLFPSAGKNAIL